MESVGMVGCVHVLPVDQHYNGQNKETIGDEDGAQDRGDIVLPRVRKFD